MLNPDIIKNAVEVYASKVADREIDRHCQEFREKMLSMKGEIVGKIVNGIDAVVTVGGDGEYTVKIILKR